MRGLCLDRGIPPRFFMDSSPGLVVQLNLPPRGLERTAVGIPHYLKTHTVPKL